MSVERFLSQFQNPTSVFTAYLLAGRMAISICGREPEGLTCGTLDNEHTKWLLKDKKFSPLSRWFAEASPPLVQHFLSRFSTIEDGLAQTPYLQNDPEIFFTVAMMSSAILSVSSPAFVDAYIPVYRFFLTQLQKRLGHGDLIEGVRNSPDGVFYRTVALTTISAALDLVSRVRPDDQVIKTAIGVVGKTQLTPMDDLLLKEATISVDKVLAGLQGAVFSEQTTFLRNSLVLANDWIKTKVR